MGYTGQAIKGFSFLSAVRIFTRILSLFKNVVIARVLSPYQFGAFGIATLVLVFAEIITETGINTFLIQEKEDIDKYIDTSWLVSIIRGTIIFLLIIASSDFISSFFRNNDSKYLLILISLVPLIRGFINPSVIKFQKELMFHREFSYRTAILIIETIFSVTLVFITRQTSALIFGMITSAIFEVILSFLLVSPKPGFNFSSVLFKKVVSYGKWITLQTVFNYFYQHGDDIVVGRILGATQLGFYDMAYRISLVPLSDVSDVMAKVTYPFYVKISEERKRLRRAFVRSLIVTFIITVPVGVLLFLFPKEIISLILGDRWLPTAPALKILGIFAFVRAISSFSSSIFLSLGKQNIFTLISLVGLAGLVMTIIPFIQLFGITGAAFSALFGTALTFPVIIYYIFKYL